MKKIFKKKDESLIVKNAFKRFSGSTAESTDLDIEEKEFCYCLIKLSLDMSLSNKDKIVTLLSKIVELADKTNGDVDHFCCDTLVVFYGLPLIDSNMFINISSFLQKMICLKENLKVIVGHDRGLYGSFGYEKRYLVTVISEKITKDYPKLIGLQEKKIYLHKELADKINNIKNIEDLILI